MWNILHMMLHSQCAAAVGLRKGAEASACWKWRTPGKDALAGRRVEHVRSGCARSDGRDISAPDQLVEGRALSVEKGPPARDFPVDAGGELVEHLERLPGRGGVGAGRGAAESGQLDVEPRREVEAISVGLRP